MAPDNYKRRRQNQTPITRYFNAGPVPATDSSFTDTTTTFSPPSKPDLPRPVQSSLLSVGARVRKALAEAEGLKKQTPAHHQPTKPHSSTHNNHHQPIAPVPYASARPELTPFCGAYKTGDVTTTSTSGYSRNAYNPGSSRTLKRTHSEALPLDTPTSSDEFYADNDDDAGSASEIDEDEAAVLNAAFGGEHDSIFFDGPERRIAALARRPPPPHIEGDFEEAPFLRSREEVEMA